MASLAALVVIAGGVVAMEMSWARKDAAFAQYTQIGQEINLLLTRYRAEFERKDLDRLLAFYADDYKAPQSGRWDPEITTTKDGIQSAKFIEVDKKDRNKAGLKEQLAAYLGTFGALDKGKQRFKIDMIEGDPTDRRAIFTAKIIVRGFDARSRLLEDKVFLRFFIEKRGIGVRNELPEWLIVRQELVRGERTVGPGDLFADVSEKTGIAFKHRKGRILTERLQFGLRKYALGGVSVVDYDDSGLPSIFFTDGVESKLYRNNGDGTFTDVTMAAGLAGLDSVTVALFFDCNNDGHPDLFVGRILSRDKVYRNNGDGTFTDITEASGIPPGGFVAAAAAADFDRDGFVDLYLANQGDNRTEQPQTTFSGRNGTPNQLFRNKGNCTFEDVTARAGVGDTGWALAVTWGDYNNNGWPDLYVANDFGRNTLYRNLGNGTFKDATNESRTMDWGYGMGVSFGDFNNDGHLDLYVSNLYSNQRWFSEPRVISQYLRNACRSGVFLQDWYEYWFIFKTYGTDWWAVTRKAMRGNTLLKNNGDGTFTDISEAADVNRVGWGWGNNFFDFDNDGRLDVFAVNGWITQKSGTDL